jgi:hypothetical protein
MQTATLQNAASKGVAQRPASNRISNRRMVAVPAVKEVFMPALSSTMTGA